MAPDNRTRQTGSAEPGSQCRISSNFSRRRFWQLGTVREPTKFPISNANHNQKYQGTSDLSQQVSLYAVGSNALRSIALRFIGLRDITVYGLRFIGLRSDRIAVGSLYGPLDGLSLDGLSLYDPIYKT